MVIENTLRTYIRKITLYPERADALDINTSLFASGILDSLGLIQIISFLEQEFHIMIPLETISIERFSTVEGIVSYIKERCDHVKQ